MKFTIFSFNNDFNHSPSAAQIGIQATIRSAALLCVIMTATPSHAATRVFYDGSEAGNTSLWSQDSARDKCTSVASAVDGVVGPYAGSRMIRCNDNGTVAWNANNSFETMKLPAFSATNEVFYRVRVRLDQNMDKTSGSAKKLLRIFGNTDTYEVVRTQNGMNWGGFFNNNANQIPTYWGDAPGDYTAQTSGWHLLEYYYNRSTGVVKAWHDKVLVSSSTISPFGSMGQNQDFYITSNFSDSHDATNHVYFDEFEVFSDSTGGTPATGWMSDGNIKVSDTNQQTLSPPHITDIKVN